MLGDMERRCKSGDLGAGDDAARLRLRILNEILATGANAKDGGKQTTLPTLELEPTKASK